MATTIPVTVLLRADGKGLTGTLQLTEKEFKQLERQMGRTGRESDRLGRRTEEADLPRYEAPQPRLQ